MLLLIKYTHITFASLSLLGFVFRGFLRFRKRSLLTLKVTKVCPHIIDTGLFFTGVILITYWGGFSAFEQSWVQVKLTAILVYIALGFMALKPSIDDRISRIAWIAGILIFIFILSVAKTKSPFGVFALY